MIDAYEGWDTEGYWDVIGDGWNPGHTLTEEQWSLEKRTLRCFAPGMLDYDRPILWKYAHRPVPPPVDPTDIEAVGRRLMALALEPLDTGPKEVHSYEREV